MQSKAPAPQHHIPDNYPRIRQPIFIVGCGRSGTTLLFNLLSTHPWLARTTGYPDGEDHDGWIKYGKCVMAGIGATAQHPKYGNGINGHQYCLHMTQDDVTESVIRDMHLHYNKEVLHGQENLRVINKNPHLSNKLDYVLSIFPDAKIIHIIRDCEPMVASWLAVMEHHPSLVIYWPREEPLPCFWLHPKPEDPTALSIIKRHTSFYPSGGAELFIDYWNKTNIGIYDQMKNNQSQLLSIRYEDLTADPIEILNRLLHFCELPSHNFVTESVLQNTEEKHLKRITPEFRKTIEKHSETVRQMYSYQTGGECHQMHRLYKL